MCKSSQEPGGPQRCSAEARKSLIRDQVVIDELETREARIVSYATADSPPWGPYIGPPPTAPPYGPLFNCWFAEEEKKNPGLDRVNAYFDYYYLSGTEEELAKVGYSEDRPPRAWDAELAAAASTPTPDRSVLRRKPSTSVGG